MENLITPHRTNAANFKQRTYIKKKVIELNYEKFNK